VSERLAGGGWVKGVGMCDLERGTTMVNPSGEKRNDHDEVVRDLVDDPADVPAVKMFVGLLGPGGRDGYSRLYFSTELKDYFDVRTEDVLLTKSLKTPENPLGGTAIWIRANAELEITRRASEDAEQTREAQPAKAAKKGKETSERFLTGQITARFLQGATASGIQIGGVNVGGGGLKSVPPVESCVPALCSPPPPPPNPPGHTAVCTLATRCHVMFIER
jgi:hypothetical protein